MEDRIYNRYKWIGLIAFALMYNLVYLSRFNVNNLMTELSGELRLTEMQQEMIAMSVFASYAAGSFVNGYLADRLGAKQVAITGVVMSSILNICVAVQSNWVAILCIWTGNGYFQSMIWVGGISLLANWWQEGERGKGIGIANFSSGMSHATAYLLPLLLIAMWPDINWQMSLAVPTSLMLVFVAFFWIAAENSPENVGLKAYDIKNYRNRQQEKELEDMKSNGIKPWLYFFRKRHFIWWCAVAMISSICRYGLLNWIPLYFNEQNGGPVLSETFSKLTLPVGMAFGTLIITWIAGTKLLDNKGIIITAMAALCGMLVVIFPMVSDMTTVLVGIFFTGFVLYGINGILWLYAIDQGCRVFSGSVAGILNAFAYLGAFFEDIIFRTALNLTGSYMGIFLVMEIFCICMVICGIVVSKKNTVVIPEVRE